MAVAAFSLEKDPGEQRDIVVPLERFIAVCTVRGGEGNTLAFGDTVDDDIEKRAHH